MRMDPRQTIVGRRVFVTGANGFIGRRLVDALDQAGAKVTSLQRSRGAKRGASVRAIVGDLNDTALLETGLREQEIVFHLAYDGRAPAAANLAAFDSVLAASAKAGVNRIVHTSSIVVYDGWPNGDLDETGSMSRPGGSGYRQAKIEMERRLMSGSIPAAILQPTIVYGPGSALWTEQFIEWLTVGDIVLPTRKVIAAACSSMIWSRRSSAPRHCRIWVRNASSSPDRSHFRGLGYWRAMRGSSAAAACDMFP